MTSAGSQGWGNPDALTEAEAILDLLTILNAG
jgi:hypothetical protein